MAKCRLTAMIGEEPIWAALKSGGGAIAPLPHAGYGPGSNTLYSSKCWFQFYRIGGSCLNESTRNDSVNCVTLLTAIIGCIRAVVSRL